MTSSIRSGAERPVSVREPGRTLAVRGLGPVPATTGGGLAVTAVSLSLALLDGHLGHAAQELLLVVPVLATAVLGGRRPAQFAAALTRAGMQNSSRRARLAWARPSVSAPPRPCTHAERLRASRADHIHTVFTAS